MSLSSPFIQRPVGTTLLTIGLALAGVIGYTVLPVAPLAASGLSHHQRERQPARRQRPDHGGVRGHAPGAAVQRTSPASRR